MAGIRILSNNAIDRATLSATTTAGGLSASNMATDIKSEVWRSTSNTNQSITATWTNAESISCIFLPFCNLMTGDTIIVKGYTNAADSTPIFTSATSVACPGGGVDLIAWGNTPVGANAFAYGGAACARMYFNPISIKKLVITFNTATNTSGYIEVGKWMAGAYWSPEISSEFGETSITFHDSSTQVRTEGGDLLVDNSAKWRKASINLPSMGSTDRATLWKMLVNNSLNKCVMLSIYPDDADGQLEKMGMICAKLTQSPVMKTPYFARYATNLEMDEI